MPKGTEKNTYGLPQGEPIRRALRSIFRLQRRQVLEQLGGGGTAKDAGSNLPASWEPFKLGGLAMSERMTPLVSAYWENGGQALYGRLQLDPDAWQVVNPHTRSQIESAALAFCNETNQTTSRKLDRALAQTREALIAGVVTQGESVPRLTERVNQIFDEAETSRARRIAQTEASRAVHAGQEAAAKESGLVAGWEWLLSSDACPICHAIADHARYVQLNQPFAVIGDNPTYATVRMPPAHPLCDCTAVEVVKSSVSGEPEPEWQHTPYRPEPGQPGGLPTQAPPRLRLPKVPLPVAVGVPIAAAATVAAVAAAPIILPRIPSILGAIWPTVAPAVVSQAVPKLPAILHDLTTVQGRIAAWTKGDEIVAKLASLDQTYRTAREKVVQEHSQATEAFLGALKKKSPEDPAVKVAQEHLERVQKRLNDYGDYKAHVPQLVAAAIGVDAAAKATITGKLAATHPAAKSIEQGQAFVESVLAADPKNPKGLRVDYARARGKNGRAYYDPARRKAWIADADQPETVAHEIGHAIEAQWAHVGQQAREFLEYRVGSEPSQRLDKLFPQWNYGPLEKGRKDRFDKAFDLRDAYYIGFDYRLPGGAPAYGTEILSMGIQRLMTDPVGFAQKDPEYCKFVVGILTGDLR